MAGDSFQEKTEQPTDKRLEEARKKGQVAQSKELSACLIILFTSIFLYFSMSHGFNEMFKIYLSYVRSVDLDVSISNIQDILSFGLFEWLKLVLPIFGLVFALSIFGNVAQTGFMWSFDAMQVKLESLNPFEGIKKLFSKRSAVEVLKSIIKIVILVYIAYTLIIKELPTMLSLSSQNIRSIIEYCGKTVFFLSVKVSITLLFIAALDFFYQKWQHKKDLMMTQQEVKEESKEREGNPQIKSRIRSLQRDMSRRRMIEDVKKADVIVTNPTTFAIALSYKIGEMSAPMVVAKGAGFVAEKIKEVAKRHGIPLMENKPLARGLFYSVKIGSYIPEQFYIIVAELLAEVYKKNRVRL
jgi:flagellar biosynthetic protein FlhB